MTWERPSLGTRRDVDNETDRRANIRPPYTEQEAFDKMVKHLRTQGKKAMNWGGLCQYYLPQAVGPALMCAVGCLIDPDRTAYNPQFLEGDVYDSSVLEALNQSGYPPELAPLLKSMQRVHDESPPSHWEEGFRDVALTYGLTLSAPVTDTIPAL